MASELGRCDALDCYTSNLGSYITCDSDFCTFGNCNSQLMKIPASVPIKTTLQGLNQAPFVRLRFEGILKPNGQPASPSDWDYTEITTGNISQPYGDTQGQSGPPECNSMIKSFQYSWGTIESGNTCKITIIDQKGSSVEKWFQRLFKNTQLDQIKDPQGVFKMKIQWGWIVAGENGECPADYSQTGEAYCIQQNFYGTLPPAISTIPVNNSSAPSRLICSPACWFLPDTLNVSYQGNKIFYEIVGIDLLQRSSEQPLSLTFGFEATPENPTGGMINFTTAVDTLAKQSLPPFTVVYKQINETTGAVEDMNFWVESGVVGSDLITKGPLGVWQASETTPFQTIRNWLNSHAVKADTSVPGSAGKGITVTFDPINRQCILWAESHPSCGALVDINTRLKAAYINAGRCSPVLSFTPTARWNFLSAGAAGGLATPISGRNSKFSDQQTFSKCLVQGRGPRGEQVSANSTLETTGSGAIDAVETATAAHRRATLLQYTIEAELRVQGDPSDFLCSPLFGYGKSIALIIINPYYIVEDDGFCAWSQLTDSSCNTVFTNPAWFILGADHQIKDGSYVTTYKLALFPGGNAEIAAGINGQITTMGGTTNIPATVNAETMTVCNQGTFPCVESGSYAIGSLDEGQPREISPGAHVFCLQECGTSAGVS